MTSSNAPVVQESEPLDATRLKKPADNAIQSGTTIQVRAILSCFYLNFSRDIRPLFRSLIKCFLVFNVLYVTSVILNGVAVGSLINKHVPHELGQVMMGTYALYFVVTLFASWLWYVRLYSALRRFKAGLDKAARIKARNKARKAFCIFQVVFTICLVILLTVALGLPYVSPGIVIAQLLPSYDFPLKQGDFQAVQKFMTALGVMELILAVIGTLMLVRVSLNWRAYWQAKRGRAALESSNALLRLFEKNSLLHQSLL